MQVVAFQDYSTAADVYSFAVVLWELLTWQVPWDDHNPFQVISPCLPNRPSLRSCLRKH